MRIRPFLTFIPLLLTIQSWAQTETFEYFTFTPPSGYERTVQGQYINFLKFNDNHSSYLQITMYKSRAGTADLRAEFILEWNDLVKKSLPAAEVPATQNGDEENGWKAIVGAAAVTSDKFGAYTQMLVTLVGHGLVTSISVRTVGNGFEKALDDFLSGVHMIIPPVAPATSAVVPLAATGTIVSEGKGDKSVAGVWRGIGSIATSSGVTNAAGTGYAATFYGSALTVRQIAFLDDGSFTFVFPDEGLLTYAESRAKSPDYWGTYKMKDATHGEVTSGTLILPFVLVDGTLQFDQREYSRVPRTDHEKLSGTYSAETNPDRWHGQTNIEPVVTFSADGTFADQGAFYYSRHVRGSSKDTQDNNFGSGTYDIINYTIIFSYSDGRKINMAFQDFPPTQIALAKWLLTKKN